MNMRMAVGESSASPAATVRSPASRLVGFRVLAEQAAGPCARRPRDVLVEHERGEDQDPDIGRNRCGLLRTQ